MFDTRCVSNMSLVFVKSGFRQILTVGAIDEHEVIVLRELTYLPDALQVVTPGSLEANSSSQNNHLVGC